MFCFKFNFQVFDDQIMDFKGNNALERKKFRSTRPSFSVKISNKSSPEMVLKCSRFLPINLEILVDTWCRRGVLLMSFININSNHIIKLNYLEGPKRELSLIFF